VGHAENKRERIEQVEALLQFALDGVTIFDIAKHVGCDPSTAHRYLKEIEQRRQLIPMDRGRYRLDPSQSLHNVSLYPTEALSIFLALRRYIRQTSKAPLFMLSAIQKIVPALQRPDLVETLQEAINELRLESPISPEHTEIWKTIVRGWLENIVVRIEYYKPREDEPTEHEIEPYLFEPAIFGHATHVIAHSRTRNAIRQFRIDRIQRATLTTMHFEKRQDLNQNDLMRHAWGIWFNETPVLVELQFSPQVAGSVMDTTYHPVEQKQLLPDGSVHWAVEVAGTREIANWIRSWGPDVKVLAPAQLRREVAEDLRRAAAQYEE